MASPARFERTRTEPESVMLPLHHGEMTTCSELLPASKSFSESSEEHQSPQSSYHSEVGTGSEPLEPRYRLTYIFSFCLLDNNLMVRPTRLERAMWFLSHATLGE